MKRNVIAIYPGSFDPVTNGHLDIITRAASIFDRIIVAVTVNPEKKPLFSIEDRVRMLKSVIKDLPTVSVEEFSGLLVHYAAKRGARVLIRGIRAVTDFDYEFQMALMNRRLEPEMETVFLVPAEAYTYLSSSLVKEVASLGGEITGLVPRRIEGQLKQKLAEDANKIENS